MTKNAADGRAEGADAHDREFGQGANPRPTKGPLQDRQASPARYSTSGMEQALGQLADKTHRKTK